MAIRKKTLRRLNPDAKEVAKLANEAQSLARRLKNLAIKMHDGKINAQRDTELESLEEIAQTLD